MVQAQNNLPKGGPFFLHRFWELTGEYKVLTKRTVDRNRNPVFKKPTNNGTLAIFGKNYSEVTPKRHKADPKHEKK